MLRSFLLYLSRHAWLRHWVETSPITAKMTSRFVAGRSLEDEIQVCGRLNAENISTTVDYLGENVTSDAEAAITRDTYLRILDRIHAESLQSTVSIKLTQFGMNPDNVAQLVERAKSLGRMVEIDMESSEYVDRTLQMVSDLHLKFGNVRAVIQAYLYRSAQDIESLSQQSIPVRLCKGAYSEPPSVAFPAKADVDANYVRLMKTLLDRGTYPAIASHDEQIIRQALEYVRSHKIAADAFEFQMLYGIRRDLQSELVREGYRLRLYVPFGDAWYPYFMRRLAERPANVLFLLRTLLHG